MPVSATLKYRFLKGFSRLLCSMSYEHILSIGKFLGPTIMERISKQRNRGLEQVCLKQKNFCIKCMNILECLLWKCFIFPD